MFVNQRQGLVYILMNDQPVGDKHEQSKEYYADACMHTNMTSNMANHRWGDAVIDFGNERVLLKVYFISPSALINTRNFRIDGASRHSKSRISLILELRSLAHPMSGLQPGSGLLPCVSSR